MREGICYIYLNSLCRYKSCLIYDVALMGWKYHQEMVTVILQTYLPTYDKAICVKARPKSVSKDKKANECLSSFRDRELQHCFQSIFRHYHYWNFALINLLTCFVSVMTVCSINTVYGISGTLPFKGKYTLYSTTPTVFHLTLLNQTCLIYLQLFQLD
jgi:hypothetical protein